MAAAAGLMAAGTALSVFGQVYSARAQAQAARENALWLEEQANFIALSTERELELAERDQELMIGEQFGAFAKAGVEMSGSAADTIRETFSRAALELEAVRMNGQMQIREALLKASSERKYARDVQIAGYMKAGATALSGGSDSYAKYKGL